MTFQVSSPASSRNTLVGASSSECRQLPETVWSKVAANSFLKHFLRQYLISKNFYIATMLPNRILRSIAAISGPRLTLATV